MARSLSVGETRRRLPRDFIETLGAAFPQALTERILKGMGAGRLTTLRVNALRADAEELAAFFRENAVKHRRVSWYPDAFVLLQVCEKDARRWAPYRDGRLYLQSLSSMIPALVLDPRPGESVLDIAAAPGSKTTQMAAFMENRGYILANEPDHVRAERLQHNLTLQGCLIAEIEVGRGEKIGNRLPERFDKVLLDVPCSGEGRFLAAEPATWRHWSTRIVTERVRLQRKLLSSGVRALKPGGLLVYSTCAVNLEENERLVQWGLERFPLEVEKIPVFIPGSFAGLTRGLDPGISRALRILPDREREGFFVCAMRKETRSATEST